MIDEKKLIAEIEGYKSAAEHFLKYKDNLEHWQTQKDLCDKFLSLINSLQEEPKFKIGQKDTLDEYAYQVAYDLSNDWIKETPDWNDVEIACKLGANWYRNFNSKKDE